jgi:hypothetical protein
MTTVKILEKIRTRIAELSSTLEPFVESNVQPSTEDCEALRKQMNELLEELAVYKYIKSDHELSPSFNIHAKISEKAPLQEPVVEAKKEQKQDIKKETQGKPEFHESTTTKSPKHLMIAINDKFRFINELFSQNTSEYNIVLEQLNNLNNWHETDVYLNSLKNVYGWKDSNEVVKYFYGIAKKRFE